MKCVDDVVELVDCAGYEVACRVHMARHCVRSAIADTVTPVALWVIKAANPWMDSSLAWKLARLSERYDPSFGDED